MTTHTVFNQAPPRRDINEFTTHIALVEAIKAFDAEWAVQELTATGALVGSADFQHDAHLTHEYPPVLHSLDGYGNRIDEVEYHPAYHRIMADRKNTRLNSSHVVN